MANTRTNEGATNSRSGNVDRPVHQRADSEELIRSATAERAYEIYRARGGDDGHDLDDWLTAEAELRGSAREER